MLVGIHMAFTATKFAVQNFQDTKSQNSLVHGAKRVCEHHAAGELLLHAAAVHHKGIVRPRPRQEDDFLAGSVRPQHAGQFPLHKCKQCDCVGLQDTSAIVHNWYSRSEVERNRDVQKAVQRGFQVGAFFLFRLTDLSSRCWCPHAGTRLAQGSNGGGAPKNCVF